jgi:hypothetical protein
MMLNDSGDRDASAASGTSLLPFEHSTTSAPCAWLWWDEGNEIASRNQANMDRGERHLHSGTAQHVRGCHSLNQGQGEAVGGCAGKGRASMSSLPFATSTTACHAIVSTNQMSAQVPCSVCEAALTPHMPDYLQRGASMCACSIPE